MVCSHVLPDTQKAATDTLENSLFRRTDTICTQDEDGQLNAARHFLIPWCPRRDSNPEPTDYESAALTVELQGHMSDK